MFHWVSVIDFIWLYFVSTCMPGHIEHVEASLCTDLLNYWLSCSYPQVQHIQWPEIWCRERSQRHRCTEYSCACLKQGESRCNWHRQAASFETSCIWWLCDSVNVCTYLTKTFLSVWLVIVDKVWRHSYLRRSPVCNLLCSDRREPGRRAAPDEN